MKIWIAVLLCSYSALSAKIPSYSDGKPTRAQIVFSSKGDGIAVWQEKAQLYSYINISMYSKEHGWRVAEKINVSSNLSLIQFVVTSRGQAIIMMQEGTKLVIKAYYPPGNRITLCENAQNPQLILVPPRRAAAIWENNGLIQLAQMNQQGNWSDPVILSHQDATAFSPSISVDDDTLVALWVEFKDEKYVVETVRIANQRSRKRSGVLTVQPDNH